MSKKLVEETFQYQFTWVVLAVKQVLLLSYSEPRCVWHYLHCSDIVGHQVVYLACKKISLQQFPKVCLLKPAGRIWHDPQ